MPGFKDIIGQEQLKEHMQTALETGKVSHAYVIQGERLAGKEFIATIFAMALQCEKGGVEPCQECHSCKQAVNHNQPDIIWVTHEKPNTIGVEDVRIQINNDMGIKPYSSRHKIYIIKDGEKMTVQAQNALLKTLEEPPEYGMILILTTNADALLPTILSRCVVLHMKPVKDELVRNFLMKTMEIPDYKADICVAFARGNIGKAKSLACSEEFDLVREEALTLMKYIGDMELWEIVAAVTKIKDSIGNKKKDKKKDKKKSEEKAGEKKKEKDEELDINDYLDIISIWYRDVLLFKATNDVNHLIFKQEIQYIRKVADKCAYEGIEQILEALEKAKIRLKANVNFELTVELLLMTIKENQK